MTFSPDEIARLRQRYLWMANSVFFLDLAITLTFAAVSGSWNNLWRSEGAGILLLGLGNWLVARRLFEPIRRYLAGDVPFEDIQRRLTQLPLLSARYVGLFAAALIAFRNSTPWWVEDHVLFAIRPTILDLVTVVIVLSIFYFTYTYFVVSDYLAFLCTAIFERQGRTLSLFFGSYGLKLVVGTNGSDGPRTAVIAVPAIGPQQGAHLWLRFPSTTATGCTAAPCRSGFQTAPPPPPIDPNAE